MNLPEHELHLWCARDADCTPELLALWRSWMNDEERARADRFYFERDRHQFTLTRGLLRATLSAYAAPHAQIAPAAWRFGKEAKGRPYLLNDLPPALQGLDFNLSHTQGMVLLGLARHLRFGVDTENYLQRPAPLEIINNYFSPLEVQALQALPPAQQGERFFHYWTQKEAFIKAEGTGLGLPLEKFGLDYGPGRAVQLCFWQDLVEAPQDWRSWLWRDVRADGGTDGFLLALCMVGGMPALRAFASVPGVSSAPQTLSLLRCPSAWTHAADWPEAV
ncbi:4'-phosphopantetheinyl transferase superfamily protein [Massilia sp. W12]|uniref:4'-phosphopantetheinyl transferase family protein n=1 Tax=Massilia sp. W12 TaxID=3126507 RepID=UPI0030D170F9